MSSLEDVFLFFGQYARAGFRTRVFRSAPLRGTIRVLPPGESGRSYSYKPIWVLGSYQEETGPARLPSQLPLQHH